MGAATATATVTGPLTGRTLEIKGGKVAAAKPAKTADVVQLHPKGDKAKAKAKAKAPAKKAPVAKGGKKITLVAKKCPARAGSARAKLWAKLKNGMTLVAAKEASIPLRFLKKMAKKGHIKIGV